MDDVNISYNGAYPNLCRGILKVQIKNKTWEIDGLSSGGSVWFGPDWEDHTEHGEWGIDFPEDFPCEYKEYITDWVNENVSWGCCGGCI